MQQQPDRPTVGRPLQAPGHAASHGEGDPESIGHCPHLSAPGAITQAINDFLAHQGLEAKAAAPSLADEPDDALDQTPCGLAQANAQGLLRRVNLPYCNWLGCAPGKLIGQRKL